MFFSLVLTGRARRLLIPYDIFLRPSEIINSHFPPCSSVRLPPKLHHKKRTEKLIVVCVCDRATDTHTATHEQFVNNKAGKFFLRKVLSFSVGHKFFDIAFRLALM